MFERQRSPTQVWTLDEDFINPTSANHIYIPQVKQSPACGDRVYMWGFLVVLGYFSPCHLNLGFSASVLSNYCHSNYAQLNRHSFKRHGADDRDGNVVPLASMVVLPKHSQLPDIPGDGNLYFECMLLIFGIIMMCLQYINLYKTVWWLPQSHAQYALNFYLIDFYLVGLISLILAFRVLMCFIQEVQSTKLLFWFVQSVKTVLVLTAFIGFSITAYWVILEHGPKTCLFLCYPAVIYLILFGFSIKPLYQRYQAWPRPALGIDRQVAPQRFKVKDDAPLGHTCTLTPDIVREEVDILKRDFNNRLKQVLFNSLTTSFYATGVPVWFSQLSAAVSQRGSFRVDFK